MPDRLGFTNQGLERRCLHIVIARTDEHAVATGGNGLHGRLRHRSLGGERLHLEVVTENDTLESEFFTKQTGDDALRERRGSLFVEGRYEDVCGHHGRDAGRDGCRKRQELPLAQQFRRVLDQRKFEMRIGAGVPVSGEMLAAGGHSLRLQHADDGCAKIGNSPGLFCERSIADHRILRIGVNVEDRSVVECDADRSEFDGQRAGEAFRQRGVAAAAKRSHRWPLGERRLEASDPSAFLVDADPGRHVGCQAGELERELGDLRRLLDVAREQDGSAETELARERSEFDRRLRTVEAGDEKLTDLTPEGEGRHALNFNPI